VGPEHTRSVSTSCMADETDLLRPRPFLNGFA
jgi:hypothetical protein